MKLCKVCLAVEGQDICDECRKLSKRERIFVQRRTWMLNKSYLKGKLEQKPDKKLHFSLLKKEVIEAIIR